MSDTKMKNLGRLALFTAALMWGISFVVMKSVLDNIPTLYILAIRFLGATLILLPVCARKLKYFDKQYLIGGILMGAVMLIAYIFQTYGLERTTPGKNAFLTSTYCVIVPFLFWLMHKKKPDKYNAIAATVCIIGIGFISLDNNLSIGTGDLLTIICGFFYALHIVLTTRYIAGRDPVMLAMTQFFTSGVLALVFAFIFETPPASLAAPDLWSMAYLTVVCTAGCIVMQVFGQKYTPPSQAAVIMTLESVFGALSSVILFSEILTPRLILGFSLSFIAVLISETKLDFLKKKKVVSNKP